MSRLSSRTLVLVDAPSNLGLSPPEDGVIPGCYKLPWALRNNKLLEKLAAEDRGVVIPPRYRSGWRAEDGDRNAVSIAEYSVRLADHLGPELTLGNLVIVLGGDCSILIGNMLALKRRGRYGLIFLDAHSDFRHPGNSPMVRAAAGEDLAIVTGHGDSRLTHIEGLGPYVLWEDVHVLGVRTNDEYLAELRQRNIAVTTSAEVTKADAAATAASALRTATRSTDGFWVHLDLDVVDSSEMPAVDCPEPDGLSFVLLARLLSDLLRSPRCAGMEVTIYDPDLDVRGGIADRVVQCLVDAFRERTALNDNNLSKNA